VIRVRPWAGWPNIVAGVKRVHSNVFSTLRRRRASEAHFCPTGRDLDKLMDACGLSVVEIVAAAQRVLERK